MSMQARASEWDHRLYNINRDVAHNFGDVMREVAARLEDGRWPVLNEIMAHYKVSQEDLGKACEAYCIFVMSAADDRKERMGACLTRSGWYDVPEHAQVALMAILGTVLSGYFWSGAREATLGGVGPCLTYTDLRERGRQCATLMQIPRWKRLWGKFCAWVTRIWDTATGRKEAGWRFRELHPQAQASQQEALKKAVAAQRAKKDEVERQEAGQQSHQQADQGGAGPEAAGDRPQ